MNTVSVTDFRDNLSVYLRLVKYKGESVRIVDEKIGEIMGELNPPEKEEGWDEYIKYVKSMFGAFRDLPNDKNRERIKKSGIKKLKRLKGGYKPTS